MRILATAVALSAMVLGLAAAQDELSLGDAAREYRQSQQKKAKDRIAPKRIITNDEIPSHPEEAESNTRTNDDRSTSGPSFDKGKKAAEQWKSEILVQKKAVSSLKDGIDKLNESIHFVEANAYSNGVEW